MCCQAKVAKQASFEKILPKVPAPVIMKYTARILCIHHHLSHEIKLQPTKNILLTSHIFHIPHRQDQFVALQTKNAER
jgi:hypothetical protein